MPFFTEIALYENRFAYTKRIEERWKKKEEAEAAASYLLSQECAQDCERLQRGKYILGLPTGFVRVTPAKSRQIHAFQGRDKYLLGLIRYHLHQFDYLLSPDLYSSIVGGAIHLVFRKISTTPGIHKMFCFKTDVSNYSANIDAEIMKSILHKHFGSDAALLQFLCSYLDERRYYFENEIRVCDSAVMQGSPLTSFFENFYLSEFDDIMGSAADVYCRYNDDIIVYADSREKLMHCRSLTEESFALLKLPEKAEKVVFAEPGEFIDFLSFSIAGSKRKLLHPEVYLSILKVLTHRMIKVREQFNLPAELCILMAIKRVDSLLVHLYMMLPFLTETEDLRIIDHAVQDCLRRVGSGKKGKRRYNIRYKTLTELGYKSIICRYYETRNNR